MKLSKEEKEYLKITETDRCVFCGIRDETLVKHHLRINAGTGRKMHSACTIPVCFRCHNDCHNRTISTQNQHDEWCKYLLERLTQAHGQTAAVEYLALSYWSIL